MKRKWSKSKKQRKHKNKKTHSKTKTRRQRGGAIVNNMNVQDKFARDGQVYDVIETETYDDSNSFKYIFIGKARAIVMHQPCGVASRCEPLVSYRIVDGPGILTWYNPDRTIHSVYQGNFVDGKKHGRGKNTFNSHPDFQEYEGYFDEGIMQGRGKMVLRNGNVYVGDFNDDYMHGKGTMTFREDNSRYEGDWHHGNMHGQGNVYDGQGKSLYSAQFINNEPQFEQEEEVEQPQVEQPQLELPPSFANNPANIFQNQNPQPPSGNIFEPSRRPPQ